jgi:cytochrome c peroxidase
MLKRGFFISSILLVSMAFMLDEGDSDRFISDYEPERPAGFPEMLIPSNNELTEARIELGKRLFYDPILSIDSSISCASCHHQGKAFADNRVISPGVMNRIGNRNAPTLTNVGYNPTFLFDGYLTTLEMQILVPIQEHAEFNHNIVEIGKLLEKDSTYKRLSKAAYNQLPNPFVITRAIASFERTLISANSVYDQEVYQNKKVMSRSAKRGMDLFFNELHCVKCHRGFNFTTFETTNNGLYKTYEDVGRYRSTKLEEDLATFKIPTLRNIALTAPYMHDGSLPDLEAVLDHYMSGGKDHKNKSPIIQPFTLKKREKNDLINFLETLTDTTFITNKKFAY